MSSEHTFNPFHQFEVKSLIDITFAGYNLHFTNSALAVLVSGLALLALFSFSKFETTKFIPNKALSLFEMFYNMVNDMVENTIGTHAKPFYKHLIFFLFIFILFLNIIGLMPFGFAPTSHIMITFIMAFVVFSVCILISIYKHGFKFFKIFIPDGTPLWMAPLILVLEMFSYLARPISLSVRLCANMIAGHVMLDVMAYFAILLGIFGIVPFAFLVFLQIFEIGVAVLQAYIFAILSCVYIGESYHH